MKCEDLWRIFERENLTFFTGVPDSTFKAWMSFLDAMHGKSLTNVIACNECEAVAIATGYNLATGNYAVVYMQNAGEGKAVNPLTSLADPAVYSIPMLLLIGWRGEPGKEDEPQHKKMGRITLPLLDVLEVPYTILADNLDTLEKEIRKTKEYMKRKSAACALIIRTGLIAPYEIKGPEQNYEMYREEAINAILDELTGGEAIISTTGRTSRELFEARIKRNEEPRDFYTVGSMGCSASIGLAIALNSKKKVCIFDGDGAVIMQMGALATIGHYGPRNLCHILFDNEAHDSTGGQPTVSPTIDFEKLAVACGYKRAGIVKTKRELLEALSEEHAGPSMIIVKCKRGARKDLGRPTKTPVENKLEFINFLRK